MAASRDLATKVTGELILPEEVEMVMPDNNTRRPSPVNPYGGYKLIILTIFIII